MENTTSTGYLPANMILSSLDEADFALLKHHLESVDLPVRMVLEPRHRPINDVYFLDRGIASVVTNGQLEVEVGMIGYEGMTGISVVLESESAITNQTYMQIAGAGWRVPAATLQECMVASSSLRKVLVGFANIFIHQISQTAMANAKGSLDQRLARWILMAHDRVGNEQLPLTHEFLSVMLGVRRAGITTAIGELGRLGLLDQNRGGFIVKDRHGLEELAGKLYTPLLPR